MTLPLVNYGNSLSRKITAVIEPVSRAVTSQLFLGHPEWEHRYTRNDRDSCSADIRFHIQVLALALEASSQETMAIYAEWSESVLRSWSVSTEVLSLALAEISRQLGQYLTGEENAVVASFIAAAAARGINRGPARFPPDEHADLTIARRIYFSALLEARRTSALAAVEEAIERGLPLIDIYIDILADSLHKIGRLWEMNQISVAQEYIATAITQFVLASIYPRISPCEPLRGSMIVTGVCGELHQIGAHLMADAMEANGWDVRFLGSNFPTSAILKAIEQSDAKVMCVSTTLLSNLPAAADLIRAVRSRFGVNAPAIAVGGTAFRYAPDFGWDIGPLTRITDLRNAVAVLCA